MDLVGPVQYKKYYGGEYTIFYNITVSRFGIHKAMLLLRKAYIYCVKVSLSANCLGNNSIIVLCDLKGSYLE